jgi:hypothetical protein
MAALKILRSVYEASTRRVQGRYRAGTERVQGLYEARTRLVQGSYKAPHKREAPICGEKTLWVFHAMVQFEFRVEVREGWDGAGV